MGRGKKKVHHQKTLAGRRESSWSKAYWGNNQGKEEKTKTQENVIQAAVQYFKSKACSALLI